MQILCYHSVKLDSCVLTLMSVMFIEISIEAIFISVSFQVIKCWFFYQHIDLISGSSVWFDPINYISPSCAILSMVISSHTALFSLGYWSTIFGEKVDIKKSWYHIIPYCTSIHSWKGNICIEKSIYRKRSNNNRALWESNLSLSSI